MSRCQECCRREVTLLHERGNLVKYARFLSRLRFDPTPEQLAELEKVKGHVAAAEKFHDEHKAECDA